MAVARDQLQIDRLRNLTNNFGWKITEQKFTDDKIIVTMEKDRAPGVETGGLGGE